MACGKPVIASALDGIPEAFAVGGCGQLVPAEDVGALAKAMVTQATGPRLDREEREALHKRVREPISLERQALRVCKLYLSLVESALQTGSRRIP
jgi:glycosyltransferase involved in cell wall biosynthesis